MAKDEKRCRKCMRNRRRALFPIDESNPGGRGKFCLDCEAGVPFDEGRAERLRTIHKRSAFAYRRGRRLSAADREEVAPTDQVAYCAWMYERARARVRRGEIGDRDPEFRDALKSMEFLLTTDPDANMIRARGMVYTWNRAAGCLDRRRETRLIADQRDWQHEDAGTRVFREPRFRPAPGVPMRAVAI